LPYSQASGFKFEGGEYMVGALARLNLNKDKLDAIFDDLKNQLSDLWPDDEVTKDDGKAEEEHLKQINDMSKLELELLDITNFVNNPTAAFADVMNIPGMQENWNLSLERIKNLKEELGQFWDKLKEAGTRLQNLDLPSLGELNDSVFIEMTNEMEESIISTCEAMSNTFKTQSDATTDPFEKARLYQLIIALDMLKSNPTPMKDYVNNAIRKKDIEAMTVSVNNQKYLEELSNISIKYQQDKSIFKDFGNIAAVVSLLSYNLKSAQLEAQRVCDCIRVFNKMKSVDNGLNDIFIKACLDYTKSFFPSMTAAEQNMFANGVSKGVSSAGSTANKFGLDRLNSVASDIMTQTKSIIDMTKSSQGTIIKH
jgi:hypothetical protein